MPHRFTWKILNTTGKFLRHHTFMISACGYRLAFDRLFSSLMALAL